MKRAMFLLALLLVGCSESAPPEPKEESVSSKVLVDFGDFTFEDPDDETASNLEGFVAESMPEGVEIVDLTVRSVHEDGEPAEAEVVAANLDRGKMKPKQFYLSVLNAVSPGRSKAVLQNRGALVESEGTTTVTTFVGETVMLYLVGPDDDVLLEVADGLLRLNQ